MKKTFDAAVPIGKSKLKLILTLIGKFLGNELDRFIGKIIHQKIMSAVFSTYSVGKLIQSIREFWCVTQAILLGNSSRPFFKAFKFLVKNSNG